MTPDLTLHRKLNEATQRIRLLLVSQWAARILCWTALACVLWMLASKLTWVDEPAPATVVGALLLAAIAGAVIGFTRRLTRMDVARLTDGRLATRERLASAVEFAVSDSDDPLVRRQIEDANARAADLHLGKAYPFRISREMAGGAFLALILFGAFFLPTLPIFWSKERRAEIAEVKKRGEEIEKLVRVEDKKASEQNLEQSKKAAKEAQRLAEAMKRGGMNKKAAMVQLSKLTKQIQEQQQRMASANGSNPKPMEKAADEAKKALEQQQKAIEKAAKAKAAEKRVGLGKNQKPGEQSAENKDGKQGPKQQAKPGQQMSPSMQQAQQALQKFAQALSDQNASQQNEALQELAQEMEKGQLSKDEMQTLQQQLQQMAQALKGTDLDKVSQQMQRAAEMMRQIKLDPETLKKLAQMMRQAGGT